MNHLFLRVVLFIASCLFYSMASHMAQASCTNTGYDTIKKEISFGSVSVSSSMPVGQVLAEIKTENTGKQYGRCDSGGGIISYAMDYSQATSGNHIYNTNLPGIGIDIQDNGTFGGYFEFPAINQHASAGNYYDSQQTVRLIKTADSVSTGTLTSGKIAHIAIGEGDSVAEGVQISLNNSSIIDSGDSTGAKIAQALTANYNEKLSDCGSTTAPAFLCSGVLLRGTTADTSYHSWDPSPSNISSGGTSFSYLRADAKFDRLAIGTTNGLIFYPVYDQPAGTYNVQILCSFPIDGDTWQRSASRCGPNNIYPTDSDVCQKQSITTADAWMVHFNKNPDDYDFQCGFDVSDNSQYGNTSAAFTATLQAMNLLKSDPNIYHYNEVVVATWPTGIPAQLPIQAFFYIKLNEANTPITGGLPSAQHDQQDYFDQTGRYVPIIQLVLPASDNTDAQFNFIASDQVISE
ncbi:hypothetical protein [Citrobacter amalonaticus]|uniref:hypothetical protein n=1 Tax=Citrobacter amalonaticus TaxID=35703 RepID=UPI00300D9387